MSDSVKKRKDPPHFIFIWTIGNVREPCFCKSPTFTAKDMDMIRFVLTIKINSGDFVELYLERIWREVRTNCEPERLKIKFELSFLGIDGLPIIKKVGVCDIVTQYMVGFREFANKHEVFSLRRAEFMPEDLLTVRCRMWRTGAKIAHPDTCFARTLLKQDLYFFVWSIGEFSTFSKDQTRKIVLKTTAFNEMTLQLFLSENDGKEYVSIVSYCRVACNLKYFMKLCLLDYEGKTVHSDENSGYVCDGIQFEEFFEKRRLVEDELSLLPNDVMSLKCEIQTEPKTVWNIIENYRYLHRLGCGVISKNEGEVLRFEQGDESSPKTSSLKKAMKDLLEKGTASDVSLKTDKKAFPAHKCILSVRSRVFKAMFTRDMKEKTSTTVEISDVDEDTFEELLSYIYTDTFRLVNWQGAINLLRAADKYELLDLKGMCSTFLKSDLSADNVCAVLNVADMHHDRELLEAAEEFLVHKKREFFNSSMWRSFKEVNSALALDVLQRIHCNRRQ